MNIGAGMFGGGFGQAVGGTIIVLLYGGGAGLSFAGPL